MLEVRQCLIGPADFLALDREPQKAAFAHRRHLAFGRVDLELEDRFQIPRDGVHHPLCGALALDKNDHVIGVARKAVSPLLQLKVELVQQDICQQWREWPTLWGAHLAGFYVLTDQHTRTQVAPDQGQQTLVSDGPLQQVHQHVMIDRVKKT